MSAGAGWGLPRRYLLQPEINSEGKPGNTIAQLGKTCNLFVETVTRSSINGKSKTSVTHLAMSGTPKNPELRFLAQHPLFDHLEVTFGTDPKCMKDVFPPN